MAISARPYLQEISIRTDVDIDSRGYPFSIPAVKQLGHLKFHPDVTFFVGENGAGKSTILEAIAISMGFGPEGGTKNVQLLRTTDSVSLLHESLKLSKSFCKPNDGYFLRAESLFNVATYMDEIGTFDGSLHACSHGEAFMALLTNKFSGKDFTFLMSRKPHYLRTANSPHFAPFINLSRMSLNSLSQPIRPYCSRTQTLKFCNSVTKASLK